MATMQETLSSSDAIIAVMGITGSGKSSFIQLLVEEEVGVGHNLTSHTAQVQMYGYVREDGRKIVLLDTPGFDDTNRADIEVLKDIAYFLSQTYRNSVQLTGIVYLHKILENRMSGSSLRNLNMFKQLCGADAYPHVVLATTMWSYLERSGESREEGSRRVEELKARKDWWGLMSERGRKTVRHTGDADSARRIVDDLIAARDTSMVLSIQRELVTDGLSLNDTGAGREVERELHEAQSKMQEDIKGIQSGYEAAQKDRDEELARLLKEQRDELKGKIDDATKAQQALKINLERLLEEKSADYQRLQDRLMEEQRKNEALLAKYEQQQAEVQEERKREAEIHSEQRAETERQLKLTESRIQELYDAKQEEAAARLKADKALHEERKKELDEMFAHREADFRRREEELARKVKQRKKLSNRKLVMPVLGMLASLGTVVTGIVTLQPGLIGTGLSGMSGISFSGGDSGGGTEADADADAA